MDPRVKSSLEPVIARWAGADTRSLFSCSALVAHPVPAFYGQDATIISTDPVSGTDIRIRISAALQLFERIWQRPAIATED